MKREPAPAHDRSADKPPPAFRTEVGSGECSAVITELMRVCSRALACGVAIVSTAAAADDEDEDRSEVGKTRVLSGAGSQRQPSGRRKGGGEPFERQLRHIGQEGATVTAQREPDAQRVAAEQDDDEQVPELTGASVGWEAEEGEQERRGQHPGVGGGDRHEVAEGAVQRRVRSAAGRQRRRACRSRSEEVRSRGGVGERDPKPCVHDRECGAVESVTEAVVCRGQFCGAHSLTTHPTASRVTCA